MSVATRRKREKEERRNAILQAAAAVFFSKGFAVATMEEIAAEAELSKGTLYLYFKNKDDLFLALSAQVVETIARKFEELARSGATGLEAIRAMLVAYAAHIEANPDHFRTLVVWMASGYPVDTETPAFGRHRQQVSRLIGALVAALERGRGDGSVRAELEPAVTAPQVWGGMFGLMQLQVNREELLRRFPQPVQPTGLVPGYIDLLVQGLRREPTSAPDPHA